MNTSVVVIIPAYEPPASFLPFLRELHNVTDYHILVVDDGSGEAYAASFEQAARLERCTLLRHGKNRGKGQALKSAFRYAMQHDSSDTVYVCADCDGQHTIRDIIRLAEAVSRTPSALVLGCRDFSKKGIPFRSSFGNRLTARLFRFLFGMRIKDTQTGLRAFSHAHLPLYAALRGQGFEYEMRMLITCALRHIPIKCMDIETRYNTTADGCERISHFSPLSDSLKILRVLLASVGRYILASLLSAALDVTAFYLFLRFVFSGSEEGLPLLMATVFARIVSSSANFLLNFKYVFQSKTWSSVWRYYVVWLGRLSVSYSIVMLLSIASLSVGQLTFFKALCDLLLSVIGYRLQRTWVFAPPKRAAKSMPS